ncbi:CHASE domain-containing protein [Marinobacter salinisoli]|uniref:histidine kinase n=1 Tax=Marinobacter salinisoli TaxID=2769486 RepID=A0ABX7MW52_9GAMM|nr:ATP-binding protein [Marinobacter salinisoli]QSP95336.1 CHASE domain-containing protein [Marinobacter salinisoli]
MPGLNRDKLFHPLIWAARLGILALMLSVALALDSASNARYQAEVRHQWQERLDDLSLGLQSTILQNIQTVWGLAANIAVQPDIDEQRFRELASVIFRLAPDLRNIGLAPDFIIRHVYPLQGNEAALGLDLGDGRIPPEQIEVLFQSRQVAFSGPINLVQGGQGLAGRIPIFDSQTGEFWGLISVILNLESLYQTAGVLPLADDMHFGLSTSSDPGDQSAMFLGNRAGGWQQPVTATLNMRGTQWTLFAEPAGGWPKHPESSWLTRSLLATLVLLVTVGTFWLTSLLLKERKLQRRIAGLFELAPVGIGLFSAHRRVLLQANRTFERTFGNNAQTLNYFDHAFDQNGHPIPGGLGIQDKLTQNFRFSGMEACLPTPQNTLLPVAMHGLLLNDHDSEQIIWLITEDVSEQKKVDRLKSEFISTVSHELRTPLTSISGSLGLLNNKVAGELPEQAARLTEIAYRNSQQLTSLINDLLDIEKLAAGKMPFQLDEHELSLLVSECIENLDPLARQRHIQLCVGELAPVRVSVEPQRFKQAVTNLLSNAIKFSPDNARVEIYTERHGHNVRLCIRDYGEGVAPDFREAIFQKFSQADASDRRARGGTGLGLAITRELMANMRGSVDYDSTPGNGATFWLELPAQWLPAPAEAG